MTEKPLTTITGEEFVRKILQGERDFSYVSCPGFNLNAHERFAELQQYLAKLDDLTSVIDITSSDFTGLVASNINLNGLRALDAILKRAVLSGNYLFCANFNGVNLSEVDLSRADCNKSGFKTANLYRANLAYANLFDTRFKDADLREADLSGAEMSLAELQKADLRGASFYQTRLREVLFEQADLRGVNGLETATMLDEANFGHTTVTRREMEILSGRTKYFKVVD